MSCPFCERIEQGRYDRSTGLAVAFEDAYPVTPGHMLVIPRRHEPDFFGLTRDEQVAVLDLAREIQPDLQPSNDCGLNVGLNVGSAAGQTVWHAHLHLIPRTHGDVDDPRGGVRAVVPSKALYDSLSLVPEVG
jgi:diadenosine tetraphosphate (Ap4A) HIT family hydrolase